ncbi:hypothetical protein JXR93_13230 [bacterium]|nr:hypothetical protein [bacterium]
MNLLNHNVKIFDSIYHIQTEYCSRHGDPFIQTQIFSNGSILWHKKHDISSTLKKDEISDISNRSHKMALFFLKKFSPKFPIIQTAISKFQKATTNAIVAMDVFSKEEGIPITGINTNHNACYLFNNLFNELNEEIKNIFNTSLKQINSVLDENNSVIVGKIDDSLYMYGMLVDISKTTTGFLLNIAIPNFVEDVYSKIF